MDENVETDEYSVLNEKVLSGINDFLGLNLEIVLGIHDKLGKIYESSIVSWWFWFSY